MNTVVAIVLMSLAAADGRSSPVEVRPEWVDAEPGLRKGIYETQVIVGPESKREECEKQVMSAVRSAFDTYAALWKETNGYGGEDFAVVQYTDEDLNRRFIAEKWEEHVKVDGADRIFLHVKLKFDAQLQQQWRSAAQARFTEQRSLKLSAIFLLAMWGLGVAHVSLRVDGLLAARAAEEQRTARGTRAVLWTTAGLLTAIPLLVVS